MNKIITIHNTSEETMDPHSIYFQVHLYVRESEEYQYVWILEKSSDILLLTCSITRTFSKQVVENVHQCATIGSATTRHMKRYVPIYYLLEWHRREEPLSPCLCDRRWKNDDIAPQKHSTEYSVFDCKRMCSLNHHHHHQLQTWR